MASGFHHATLPHVPRTAFSCAFVRHNCAHDVIFNDVYLRTNRTNHTKIMRCFPHCCPDHRERSYCGSPIHLELVGAAPSVATTDLVVYGRFRPPTAAPLRPGDRISVASIRSSLQVDDPSQGEWVESKLVRFSASSTNSSWLFEVNPSGRWYYPWSGAATIAMRATEHVFEAIAFRTVGNGVLEVVGGAKSPNFRLMSFRRGDIGKSSSSGSPVERQKKPSALSTRAPTPTLGKSRKRPASTTSSVHQTHYIPHPSPPPLHLLEDRYSPSLLQRKPDFVDRHVRPHEPTWLSHGNAYAVKAVSSPSTSTTLEALLQWLQEVPASSIGSKWMLSWEAMVQTACEAHVLGRRDSARIGLVPILSALNVAATPPKPTPATLDLIDAAVRVLLHLWLDPGSVRASNDGVQRFGRFGSCPDRQQLEHSHETWLRDTEARAKRYLHSQTRATWEHLASKGSSYQAPSSPQSGSAFSFRSFVAQTRQALIHQYRVDTETARCNKRQRAGGPSPRQPHVPIELCESSRYWRSRMEGVAVEADALSPTALSLLTVLEFWRHLSCIRIDCTTTTLRVSSVFNTAIREGCYTQFILDGKHRWFSFLPSGSATTGTTCLGFVVGDYVAYATRAGTIHVTTYLWPRTLSGPSDTIAYAWHWTIDATSLGTTRMSVSVVVESAPVKCAGPTTSFETMKITEKMQCIGRWHHVCQAQFAYQHSERPTSQR